jgi:hypothetical protein
LPILQPDFNRFFDKMKYDRPSSVASYATHYSKSPYPNIYTDANKICLACAHITYVGALLSGLLSLFSAILSTSFFASPHYFNLSEGYSNIESIVSNDNFFMIVPTIFQLTFLLFFRKAEK